MQDPVADLTLLQRWRDGDETAADEFFERYAGRTWALAETLIADRLKARFDGDDVVQSVFRTFLRRSQAGAFDLGPAESLWNLLSTIARYKIRRRVRFHLAQQRNAKRDAPLENPVSGSDGIPDAEVLRPTPTEALELVDEIETVLRDFEPWDREVLRLCLEGHSTPEIAGLLECSRWSVRRALNAMGFALEQRLRNEPNEEF
jgi:RNA polymerase sigma-70 factor (ECF subfamily)